MKKARLIVTYDCLRSCSGCCNRHWMGEPPEVIRSFEGFDEVLITGGEPLLFLDRLVDLTIRVKKENPSAKVYVYTAAIEQSFSLFHLLRWKDVDGVCLTLHEKRDVKMFDVFFDVFQPNSWKLSDKSLRLNVFEGIGFPKSVSHWKVKKDVRWLPDCPLPKDEKLYRLEDLWSRQLPS